MTQKEKVRLLLGAALHVLETLTDDEAESLYAELYNAADQTPVDPYDFHGETLRDLCGGEVISIVPAGVEEGVSIVIFTEDKSLVEIEGWADIFKERVEDTRFDITRTDVVKHGALTPKQIDVFAAEVLRIVRTRARAELDRRRQEAAENVDR